MAFTKNETRPTLVQTCAIPSRQLGKNIYKLTNHHIALIKIMHNYWMIFSKCNTPREKGKYDIVPFFLYNTLIGIIHKRFPLIQYP